MAQKPAIPKGTRDFTPEEMSRRNYIFDTIREAFDLFGYQQIETPAMENLSTLMGKYGEEGDKLLFKILNSGDFLKKVSSEDLEQKNLPRLASEMCEKGLRYDLTVPFARFVVMHRNDLQFPFKRFQMQPVWRADRPQKGRYREFYQCDADVIGSPSLNNEVELVSLIDYVFNRLGIRVAVKLNNRKILAGIAETIGAPDKIIDITVAIDKIEKIGLENVQNELREKGLDENAITMLTPLLSLAGSSEEKLTVLKDFLKNSEEGIKGIEEMETVLKSLSSLPLKAELELDVSLARGLNYYTGTIIEVKALDYQIGSITGGGRYDNLTGVFGLPDVTGVGISFGADRIYDVMLGLNLFPESALRSIHIMFANMGEAESLRSLQLVSELRNAGVSAMLFPDKTKISKQFSYASRQNIRYVAVIGETELSEGKVKVKDMQASTEETVDVKELCDYLASH